MGARNHQVATEKAVQVTFCLCYLFSNTYFTRDVKEKERKMSDIRIEHSYQKYNMPFPLSLGKLDYLMDVTLRTATGSKPFLLSDPVLETLFL